MRSRIIIIYIIAAFILSGYELSTCNDSDIKKELQAELDSIALDPDIPGISVAIVMPGDKLIHITSGLADREKNILMTPEHKLFTGSIGKTYVAALALQLIEEGKLDIDDPVKEYLGTESWFSRIPNSDSLTIHMLLTHTSGITRWVFKPGLWERAMENPDMTWTPEERLSYVFDDEPLHAAGRGWGYSDTNYIILGMIIEKIMNSSYYDLLKKRILEPLNLANTIPAIQRELPGLSPGYTGYTEALGIPEKVSEDGIMVFNPQMEWTGGGLIVTTADLALWAKYLYEGKLLNEATLRMMTEPVPFRAALPDGAKYGMGTFVWETDYGKSYGHSGFMPGYMALMEYLPEYGFSIAIQLNTDQGIKKSLYNYLDVFREKVIDYLKEY